MIQITVTRRIKNSPCGKCKEPLQEGDYAMVNRNQSGKRVCMKCWNRMSH